MPGLIGVSQGGIRASHLAKAAVARGLGSRGPGCYVARPALCSPFNRARIARPDFMRLLAAALLGLAACGSPSVTAPATLSVVNLSPTDGAVEVPTTAVQSACFSAPVRTEDATPANFWVADDSGAKADSLTVQPAADPHCVSVGHAALHPGTGYTLNLKAGIRAADGSGTLPVSVQSRFTTGSAP